jgi:PIN domain nuclease of toxin-antitoxin system
MKILLDTCTFLWIIIDDAKMPRSARETYLDQENEVFLSVVSEWEIALKHSIGKLSLPANPVPYISDQRIKHGVNTLPLTEPTVLSVSSLPFYHKDPFDRMLVCQAITLDAAILTPDPLIRHYPVRVIW